MAAYRGSAPRSHAVLPLVPESSIVRKWIASAFDVVDAPELATAVVFSPDRLQTHALPAVACLPVVRDDDWFVAEGAWAYAGVRADAYASNSSTLLAALRFVLAEDRAARLRGPLRLTWLGPLGELFPSDPPIGTSFPIREGGVDLGRSPNADICLRQGAHSDQCSVARRHANLAPVGSGVHVYDLESTNGIYVGGVRVQEALLEPGDELAICGTLRLRVDGCAPIIPPPSVRHA
jgi:hypothetical protein